MNAVSLYLSTCRYIMQASPENPYSWGDLYKYLPYLRQALSCCVCTHILHIPMGPIDTICQHHVCQQCIGGKMRLYPSCSWCKDYAQFQENTQLRIVIQCYKKLCQYLTHSTVLNVLAEVDNGDKNSILTIIHEGSTIPDCFDYGANPLPLSSFYTKCQSPRRYLEFDHEAEKNAAASSSTSKDPMLQPASPQPNSPGVSSEIPSASPPVSPGVSRKERKRSRSGKISACASSSATLSDLGHSFKENETGSSMPHLSPSTCSTEAGTSSETNNKQSVDIDSDSEKKQSLSLENESATESRDSSSERTERRDSAPEHKRSRSMSGTDNRTRHKSGGKFASKSSVSDNPVKTAQKELSSNEAVSKSDSGCTSSDSERERKEKKEQRSRRTSTTRVAIGDCRIVDSSHKQSGEREKATVAEPDTSQPAPLEKPPPLSPRVCLGEHDYMKESPYYSVSMPNGNEPKLTIRRKHPSNSPGQSSPRKRHRTDDDIPHLEIAAPMLSSTVASPRTKKKRLNKDVKKKGCRCGTAASTPGKLTCCGQRCPCYSTHKPCLDCSCRGCHNPRKLALPDSTVKEDDNEDAEIFVDI